MRVLGKFPRLSRDLRRRRHTRLSVHDTFGFSRGAPGVSDPGNISAFGFVLRCRTAFEQIPQMPAVFGTGEREHLEGLTCLSQFCAMLIKSVGVDDQCFRLRVAHDMGLLLE